MLVYPSYKFNNQIFSLIGHYVSDVYNYEEQEWYHYDDESVTHIPESAVLANGRQKNGYIFFYIHRYVFFIFIETLQAI